MILKTRLRALSSLGALILLLLGLITFWPSPSRGEYTLVVNSHERRGVWEGWGCSLAWWGNGIGGSAYESLYEDLFFTRKSVPFLGQALPGLGLNIVRYNVGGGGRNDHFNGAVENIPPAFSWYKDIDGYWITGTARCQPRPAGIGRTIQTSAASCKPPRSAGWIMSIFSRLHRCGG